MIYKQNVGYTFYLELEGVDKMLSIKTQYGEPVLYFTSGNRKVEVLVIMTGEDEPDTTYTYLGTAMLENDTYVAHYFYKYV